MNFFGRYPIETEHKELVTLIREIKKHLGRLSLDQKQFFIKEVSNALEFYSLAHTSPINRFYRARFTKENGPKLALTAKNELSNVNNAFEYLQKFLIEPFECKQTDSSFFGSRISDTSRIHYFLQELAIHKKNLGVIKNEMEGRHTPAEPQNVLSRHPLQGLEDFGRAPTPVNTSIQ